MLKSRAMNPILLLCGIEKVPSVAAMVFLAVVARPVAAQQDVIDRVRLITGGTASGTIESMTNSEVRVAQEGRTTSVPVNEIQTIQFDREPIELTRARAEIGSGAYQEALDALTRLRPADITRSEVRVDAEFQTALAKARLALQSGDNTALIEAGRAMNDFVNAHRNHFRYYEAVEVLGDLLAAVGRYDQAQIRYAALANTPWPDFKIRAGVLEGRSLAAQGKHQDAIARFEQALAIDANLPGVPAQRLAARLGKAQSQVALGQSQQAVQEVEQIIAEAEPEALELQARAHIVLGQCHLGASSPKEALYAFLYVDALCASVAEAHAEALFHLVPIYQQVGRLDQSRQTRERLLDRYPQSTWAKRLSEGG